MEVRVQKKLAKCTRAGNEKYKPWRFFRSAGGPSTALLQHLAPRDLTYGLIGSPVLSSTATLK